MFNKELRAQRGLKSDEFSMIGRHLQERLEFQDVTHRIRSQVNIDLLDECIYHVSIGISKWIK